MEDKNKLLTHKGYAIRKSFLSEKDIQYIEKNCIVEPKTDDRFGAKKDGKFKIISFYAKRARGLMARYVIQNSIQDPSKLKGFDLEGYQYVEALSQTHQPVFQRKQQK